MIAFLRQIRGFACPLLLNGGSAVAAQGTTFALTVVLARALGPIELARYSIMQSTITTVAAVTQFGLAFTVTRFVASMLHQDTDEVSSVLSFAVRTTLALSIFASVILATGSSVLSNSVFHDTSTGPFLMLSSLALPFLALTLVYNGALNGAQLYRSIAINTAISASVALSLGIAGGLKWGAFGAAVALGLATILRWYLSRRAASKLQMRNTKNRTSYRATLINIWKFALPAGLIGLTMTPALWITNALLANHWGLRDLGIFITAFTIKSLVVFVPQQIAAVFFPRYIAQMRSDADRGSRLLWIASAAITLFASALAALVVFAAPAMMHVFGKSFLQGSRVLEYLMIAAVGEAIATILSYRLAANNQMWLSFWIYSTPKDVILVAGALIMVPTYGSAGLAIAHALAWSYGVIALLALDVASSRTRRMRASL